MNGYRYNKHLFHTQGMDFYERVRQQREMARWCKDMFGNNVNRWENCLDGFHFKDEKDYMLFLLRWS